MEGYYRSTWQSQSVALAFKGHRTAKPCTADRTCEVLLSPDADEGQVEVLPAVRQNPQATNEDTRMVQNKKSKEHQRSQNQKREFKMYRYS